jgi:hypothetical protein
MSNYALEFVGGGQVSEIVADNDTEAISVAAGILGDDVVVADQWDAAGSNDDDEPVERLLFWATEADAKNDHGANAIAQLTVMRR